MTSAHTAHAARMRTPTAQRRRDEREQFRRQLAAARTAALRAHGVNGITNRRKA